MISAMHKYIQLNLQQKLCFKNENLRRGFVAKTNINTFLFK